MKYELEMTHRFVIETNDIEAVLRDYTFPDFEDTPISGDPEFLDGKNTWKEMK